MKQIMNKVFFKIREEFVAGDSYKGSAVISSVLNVIKVSLLKFSFNHKDCDCVLVFDKMFSFQTMTLKMTTGEDEESEEEDESGDEESGSDEQEEGETSGEGENEEDDDESGDEEDESGQVEEKEGGQEEKGENETHKVEEVRENEEKEKVEESDEDESGSDEEEGGEVDEGKSGVENEKQDEEAEQHVGVKETEEDEGSDAKTPEDENVQEDTTMGSKDVEGVPMDSEGPPVVIEDTSPLHATKSSSDSENDEPEVPPLGKSEDNDSRLGKSQQDGDGLLGIVRDNGSSEEDLETISNRPVLGSEHTSLSSGEENDGNIEDDQAGGNQGPPDLPNVEEIPEEISSKDAEETGEQEKSNDDAVEDEQENENGNDEVKDGSQVKSETGVVAEEKAKEEKKPQSLLE